MGLDKLQERLDSKSLYLGDPSMDPWKRSDPPETEFGPEPLAAPFMFKGRRSSSSRVSLIS